MKYNEPVLLCMELYGNVTINKKLIPAEGAKAGDYLRERITHYTDRDYPIPDSKLIVMGFPNPAKLSNPAFDGYRFIESCKQSWPSLHETLGVRVPFEGKLQLAAYCLSKGMEPTYGAMQREYFSPGFSEFRSRQKSRIGLLEDSFQRNIPRHKRPDDWSFVMGMTGRTFSEDERKDILALGCIVSNGMERYMLTPANFPSLDYIHVTPSFVQHVLYDKPMPAKEYQMQSMELKMKASEILSRLYPEIAPVMKDLSGLATGTPGNEVYGLIGGSGVPNFVHDNYNPVTDNNPQLGFMDFIRFYCQADMLEDAPNLSQYRFVRLRGDGMSYNTVKTPTNGDYWQHWHLFLDKAKTLGIKPMNDLGYLDASYCLCNGRNPLHPRNHHRQLVLEPSYMKYVNEAINRQAEQRAHRAGIASEAKRKDAPLNGQRNTPTMKKKRGQGL